MMILAVGSLAFSLASSVLGPSLVFALATTQPPAVAEPAPAPAPPSAIEQALIERACAGAPSAVAASEGASALCRDTRLLALRSEFGRDLSRLSTSERRKLDAACSQLQTTRGREAYLDCLHAELASLSARRTRVTPQAPAEPVAAAAAVDAVPSATPAASPSSSFPLVLAGAVLVVVAGAGAGVFVVRARRARHACRVCLVRVSTPGDLCQSCRHDAAEALRRAAAERAERQRAQEDEERRQRDEGEALRLHKERAEEDARLRRLEEGRLQEEAARQREEERQREEDAERRRAEEFQRRQAGVSDDDQAAFDPYPALGLATGATDAQVRAAYEAARQKYDPDQVAHLGDDAQMHFAGKLRAAERAYQMLVGDADAQAVGATAG